MAAEEPSEVRPSHVLGILQTETINQDSFGRCEVHLNISHISTIIYKNECGTDVLAQNPLQAKLMIQSGFSQSMTFGLSLVVTMLASDKRLHVSHSSHLIPVTYMHGLATVQLRETVTHRSRNSVTLKALLLEDLSSLLDVT